MELRHGGGEAVHALPRCRLREHRRKHGGHKPSGRQLGRPEAEVEALFYNVRRQGAGPPGIRTGKDERHRQPRTLAVELERKRSTERQPYDVRTSQAERSYESRQAVGVVRHPERRGRILRSTGPRRVPGHDRELIRKGVDLALPRRATVSNETVQENKRWSLACPLVRDAKPPNLNLVHDGSPAPIDSDAAQQSRPAGIQIPIAYRMSRCLHPSRTPPLDARGPVSLPAGGIIINPRKRTTLCLRVTAADGTRPASRLGRD